MLHERQAVSEVKLDKTGNVEKSRRHCETRKVCIAEIFFLKKEENWKKLEKWRDTETKVRT